MTLMEQLSKSRQEVVEKSHKSGRKIAQKWQENRTEVARKSHRSGKKIVYFDNRSISESKDGELHNYLSHLLVIVCNANTSSESMNLEVHCLRK